MYNYCIIAKIGDENLLYGQNIAVMRKKKGINQEELAHMLSINTATLSRWENGYFEPKVSVIKKLCEVLNCTEMELLNGPSSESWELRLVVSKGKEGGTIDMTSGRSSAVLNVGDDAMAVTLSAPYELWEDDAKFEELIADLKRKRAIGLKTRREDW